MSISVEREVKLSVAEDFELPAFEGVQALSDQQLRTVYFDTPDLRLARWGLSLRCRTGEGDAARWTLKVPGDEPALARTEVVVDAPTSAVPDELERLVRAHVRDARLAPVAVLEARRRRLSVPGVAEIDDDDVAVLDGERVVRRFREVELELVDGADGDAASSFVDKLLAAGASLAEATSKLEQALGDVAHAPPEVVGRRVDATSTLAEVARAAIAAGVIRLIRHDPGVRIGEDAEDVHQARVATRRLRSDLKTFAAAFASDGVTALRDELKWIGACLGHVRDADVLLERLGAAGASAPVVRRLQREREAARTELLAAMDGERYVALVSTLVDAANGHALSDGSSAGDRAGDVLAGVVHKEWRKAKRVHAALGAHPEDAALHELRIRAKRARYASEASAAVLGKPASRFAKALAGLQGALGDLQDAVVAEEWLTRTAKVSAAGVAFTCGLLVAHERAAQEDARQAWLPAWDDVVAARKRWRS